MFHIADIGSSGSLSECASVYLEEHMRHEPRLSPVPEESSMPITAHPALSGRLTEESGYGTHASSTQTHNCLMHISSCYTSLGQVEDVSQLSTENGFIFEVESKVSAGYKEDSTDEDQLETDNVTVESVPALRRMNSIPRTSTPISVPTRNSSSSSLTSRPEQAAASTAANDSAPAVPPGPKRLTNKGKKTGFFRWVEELFAPSPAGKDTYNVLPGVKIVF